MRLPIEPPSGEGAGTWEDGSAVDPLLVLYAAGELPADERAAVERAIAADPAVAATAAAVRRAYEQAAATLGAADAADPVPAATEAASVRQAGRAIRQWHARRAAAAAHGRVAEAELPGRGTGQPAWWRQLPTWAYPAAVAAGLALGVLAWWGVIPDAGPHPSMVAQTDEPAGDDAVTRPGAGAVAVGPDADDAAARLERSFTADDSAAGLADAETQANGLGRADESTLDAMFADPGQN